MNTSCKNRWKKKIYKTVFFIPLIKMVKIAEVNFDKFRGVGDEPQCREDPRRNRELTLEIRTAV